jgi:hypothetical protein
LGKVMKGMGSADEDLAVALKLFKERLQKEGILKSGDAIGHCSRLPDQPPVMRQDPESEREQTGIPPLYLVIVWLLLLNFFITLGASVR